MGVGSVAYGGERGEAQPRAAHGDQGHGLEGLVGLDGTGLHVAHEPEMVELKRMIRDGELDSDKTVDHLKSEAETEDP